LFPTARTFPQIKVNGDSIGGYTDLEAWYQNRT
jgi:glutaredoxin